MLDKLKAELKEAGDIKKAEILSKYFKTGKGQYGEGDIFLGIIMPEQRKIAKKYSNLGTKELQNLLDNRIHEHRMTALLILTNRYKKSDEKQKKDIAEFYLKNTKNINNWDLVDLSAPNILGDFLRDKNKTVLLKLAKSDNLWERRISVLSTFNFIRHKQFEDSLKLGEMLLKDNHDLIHKAVGWMLREIGKRDINAEERFLNKHYKTMPRTMLRYAIEKFSKSKKKFYLKSD